MKCLILAAGYATRLYPLTENYPKPLLKIGDKSILDWLIDDIDEMKVIDEYIIVSNHKFINHFNEWADSRKEKINVLDDGTMTNDNRLGAVKDIQYAIDKLSINDDMLVMAGDNLLDFSLKMFVNYFKEKQTSCIMRYYEEQKHKLQKSGVITIDENDKVLKMSEKPSNPESNWCCPAFYVYKREDIPLVKMAIEEGCNVDAPGSFISWLVDKRKVHAMKMPGKRYDIGNMEDYIKTNEQFKVLTI